MGAFSTIRSNGLSNLSRTILSSNRIGLYFSEIRLYRIINSADSGIDGSVNLAAEREEAKSVLTSFLKEHCLKNVDAVRTVKKSENFVQHLVSKLQTHKSLHLVAGDLKILDTRNALLLYLESLRKEHGSTLVDMVEHFPNQPLTCEEKSIAPPVYPPQPAPSTMKLNALSRISTTNSAGELPPHVVYLIELGMDHEQLKGITCRFPSFAYCSLEENIKPVVDFLLDYGFSKSDVCTILDRSPALCGNSQSENFITMMAFFKNTSMQKKQLAKLILRFPRLFQYKVEKVKANVDFLLEMGISPDNIGKSLTRCPTIIGQSVEEKLRPTAEYFRSLGVDVAVLLSQFPQTFGLSIENKLKPVTNFFLERGYTIEEIGTMLSRFGSTYALSIEGTMIPKWEFFLTMEYPRFELVQFPQYFGYSLESRIKPRYARLKECGIRMRLNTMLSKSNEDFEMTVEKEMKKILIKKSSDRGVAI